MYADVLLICFCQWENSPTSHVVPIGSLMFLFSFHMLFPLVCLYCQSQPFLTYIRYHFFGWAEFFVFKIEAAGSWKTLIPVYQNACRDILDNNNLDLYICLFTYLMIMSFSPVIRRMMVTEEYKEHWLVLRHWFRICDSTEKLLCSHKAPWPIS